MGQSYKNETTTKEAAKKRPEKSQPWKAIWPPKDQVQPVGNQVQEGQKMVIMEGCGGAYPNTIKESEGRRL